MRKDRCRAECVPDGLGRMIPKGGVSLSEGGEEGGSNKGGGRGDIRLEGIERG